MAGKMNLVGKKFGRWTVLAEAPKKNGKRYWHCQCDCGVEKDVYGYSLTSGVSESCGCLGKERRAEANYKNLVGQKFGKLIVLSENKTENGKRYWNCQCDCGKKHIVLTGQLTSGKTKSCGCLRKDITNYKDITNQTFGYLTALNIIGRDNSGNIIWKCKCKCGNETNVVATQLLQEKTKSCGCLQKEKTILRNIQDRQVKIGDTYGYLKVTGDGGYKQIGNRRRHQSYCICLKCGKENVIKLDNSLLSKETLSCGCMKSSFGEDLINNLLKNNNINFEREKTFPTCYFKDTNRPAKFDFYVDNKYIIEYDGKQHYKVTGGWNTKEQVEKTQEHDKIKNQWCKEKNIPLIRIPYTHLDDLCIDDLLLETSSFIIN